MKASIKSLFPFYADYYVLQVPCTPLMKNGRIVDTNLVGITSTGVIRDYFKS